jgi:amidase
MPLADALWAMEAGTIAAGIRARDFSCREVVHNVLDRVSAINPRINALPVVLAEEALVAADAADALVRSGEVLPPLLGVPVTIKINVDQAGQATSDGVVAQKDLMAASDSPSVANLRAAGCIIIGRSNTPAYSLRWFTDNDLHGRTLNPWDASVTPGGSSGGAAAAVATGMGAIGHGNDYGGSVRYPAACCGVVGLRGSAGRFAAFNETAKSHRAVTLQLMSTQGVLTRSIADAGLAMAAMAAADVRDPLWVPVPLAFDMPLAPFRVALFRRTGDDVDPAVDGAVVQAGRWLEAAGYEVEEFEPPLFDEATALWRTLVYDDQSRGGLAAVARNGGQAAARNVALVLEGHQPVDRDTYLEALAKRHTLMRNWSEFFARYPVIVCPVSWRMPFPVDEDIQTKARLEAVIAAQAPLLAPAMLGLPGLSVPAGQVDGIPVGVQVVAARFREDLCLKIGAIIEQAAGVRLSPTALSSWPLGSHGTGR